MAAVKSLNKLLGSMKPELVKEELVFCTVSSEKLSKLKIKPLLIFKEKEGITLILPRKTADKNKLSYASSWAMITFSVHSDLNAVGFLEAILTKLALYGISVNVVSAYYHDHLFVPIKMKEKTMKILKDLSKSYC